MPTEAPDVIIKIKENWFTRKPDPRALPLTFALTLALYVVTYLYLNGIAHVDQMIAATQDNVYNQHQYYRAWTTLFAHGDAGHLASNLFLFVPLSYWLIGYFGAWFFPIAGIAIGGLMNLWVLKSMPAQVSLIGISGVIYWMGAAALTLFLLADRRHAPKRRFASALFLFLILFVPDTYLPEVSYRSHFYGFLLGVPSAALLFAFRRSQFLSAEVKEIIIEDLGESLPVTTTLADGQPALTTVYFSETHGSDHD